MSRALDLVVRGGSVITPEGSRRADLGIADGQIVVISDLSNENAAETIDAAGMEIFPGILDAHVHFNEPGRADWEGLTTGSAALAAGGGTWFCDMPLNSSPPVIDARRFAEKHKLAAQKSLVDFSLWGGLVPGNLDQLEGLRDAGAMGLKAFMCGSGIDEFPGVTDAATLRDGMKKAAALGMLVAVHAEDEAMARRLTDAARARGETDVRSWLATRPVEVELAAIRTALDLAGETGCALHVVHVSSAEGIALITEAKKGGVNVSAETCPHYLLLNEEAVFSQGAPAKCTPPLRPEASRQKLWEATARGEVDTIGSDHSPAPPAMKLAADFFAIWGGISGIQHGFPLLLSEAVKSDANAMPRLAALLAANVAARFKLAGKGRLAEGFAADFSLLDRRSSRLLKNHDLLYRHAQGPYDGRNCAVEVKRTVVRGRTVYDEGRIASGAGRAQFIRPTP